MKRLYNIHQVELKEREKKQATHAAIIAQHPLLLARETIIKKERREKNKKREGTVIETERRRRGNPKLIVNRSHRVQLIRRSNL